mmetsp:Transcript_9373/g.28689  ORF Transcript_9373/g.28689 Transcript_9373/m.28689 type:complete len:202 (-) Transcript_9373:345-950(-)
MLYRRRSRKCLTISRGRLSWSERARAATGGGVVNTRRRRRRLKKKKKKEDDVNSSSRGTRECRSKQMCEERRKCATTMERTRSVVDTQKRPNHPLAASLRSSLISSSSRCRLVVASSMRACLAFSLEPKRPLRKSRCWDLLWTTRETVCPERTSMARMTRLRPTPRVDHISVPKVALHIAIRSPSLTSIASALPPFTTSLM